MRWLEAEIVSALCVAEAPERREAIAAYVGESIDAMPTFLRLGVRTESIGLGVLTRLSHIARPSRDAVTDRIERIRNSRIQLIRQYERMLGSLVTFAALELPGGTPVEAVAPAAVVDLGPLEPVLSSGIEELAAV